MDVDIVNAILRLCVEQQTRLFEVPVLGEYCLKKCLCTHSKHVLASVTNYPEIFKISRDRNRIELSMPVRSDGDLMIYLWKRSLLLRLLVWIVSKPLLWCSQSEQWRSLFESARLLWLFLYAFVSTFIPLPLPTCIHRRTTWNYSWNTNSPRSRCLDESLSSLLSTEGKQRLCSNILSPWSAWFVAETFVELQPTRSAAFERPTACTCPIDPECDLGFNISPIVQWKSAAIDSHSPNQQ